MSDLKIDIPIENNRTKRQRKRQTVRYTNKHPTPLETRQATSLYLNQ